MPTKTSRRLLTTFVLAALPLAAAAQSEPYYIGVSEAVGHATNLLRVSDGAQVPDGLHKSDTYSATSLVGGVNQGIGRQRLIGSGTVSYNRYARNDDFNGTTYAANLGLAWETIGRLSGNVDIDGARTLRPDLRGSNSNESAGRNIQSNEGASVRAALGTGTRLALEAGGSFRDVAYSNDTIAYREYREWQYYGGVRWRPGASTTLGLNLRRSDTDYRHFFDRNVLVVGGTPPTVVNLRDLLAGDLGDSRTRDDVDLVVTWAPSEAVSSVNARFSFGRTRYDNKPEAEGTAAAYLNDRDFSATLGQVNWEWRPTGKLQLTTRLARDVSQDADYGTGAISRTTDSLRISAQYALTAKVAVNGNVGYFRRTLERSTVAVQSVVSSGTGHDHTAGGSLGVRWQALRNAVVGCSASHDYRSKLSNQDGNGYRASTYSCFGQLTLQL